MFQKIFFTFVIIFAVATQTISAKQDMRELIERTAGLLTTICPLLNSIPTLGPMIGGIIGCSNSTGGGMGSGTGTGMGSGTGTGMGSGTGTGMGSGTGTGMGSGTGTGMGPGTGMGSGMGTGTGGLPTMMMPTMASPMSQKSLNFLNPIACPVLGFANSFPLVGSPFVNSFNNALFGCDTTKFSAPMGK